MLCGSLYIFLIFFIFSIFFILPFKRSFEWSWTPSLPLKYMNGVLDKAFVKPIKSWLERLWSKSHLQLFLLRNGSWSPRVFLRAWKTWVAVRYKAFKLPQNNLGGDPKRNPISWRREYIQVTWRILLPWSNIQLLLRVRNSGLLFGTPRNPVRSDEHVVSSGWFPCVRNPISIRETIKMNSALRKNMNIVIYCYFYIT